MLGQLDHQRWAQTTRQCNPDEKLTPLEFAPSRALRGNLRYGTDRKKSFIAIHKKKYSEANGNGGAPQAEAPTPHSRCEAHGAPQ